MQFRKAETREAEAIRALYQAVIGTPFCTWDAQSGEIDGELLHEIGSPMIPEDQYAAIVNGGM